MNYRGILKRQTLIIVFSFIALTIAVAGASYALFYSMDQNQEDNIVTAGDLEVNFGTSSTTITSDMLPTADADAMVQEGFSFTIQNTGTLPGKYYIALYNNTTGVSDLSTFLDHGMIRVSIDDSEPQTLSALPHTEETAGDTNQNTIHYELLSNGIIQVGKTKTHTIRVWVNEEADTDIIGKIIKLQIEVVSIVAKEGELPKYADACNANLPELENGLIPVLYQNNKWVKANLTQKWFDYCNQEWANAVTVKETNRSAYTSAAAGTEIKMEDINTMWVWVPRYEYQTDNLGTASERKYAEGTQKQPGAININFVSKETTTPSASNFLIHPAFTFGTQELSGMWVAKFEMSPAPESTCATAANKTNCDITTFAPEIKPSAPSWRVARVGTFFTAIQTQMNGSNGITTYGIKNSDTHMIKNMEWGAIAYLSQSIYGKYGNPSYEGANKEVAINNCSKYITGIGGDTISASHTSATCTTNTYETAKGQAASTTGNIYGIYDMSAGAYDYVMGVMKESTNNEVAVGNSSSDNSGFSGKLVNGTEYTGTYGYLKDIDAKYYDVYNYGTTEYDTTAYQRGHLGDGTREVAGWYQDSAGLVGNSRPWFLRGAYIEYGVNAGIFCFGNIYGNAAIGASSRAVLVLAAS